MAQMRMSKQKVFSAAELDEHDHIRPQRCWTCFSSWQENMQKCLA